MFLIRDWDEDECFGLEGGRKYMEEFRSPDDSNTNKDFNRICKFLFKTFEEIPCCLLPYPGDAIKKNDLSTTKGTVVNIFVEKLE